MDEKKSEILEIEGLIYDVKGARFADEGDGAGAAGSGNPGANGGNGSGDGEGAGANGGKAEDEGAGDKEKDLAYWKKQAQDHAREAQGLRRERSELKAKVDKFEESSKTELERAQDAAKKSQEELANAKKIAFEAKVESRAAVLGFADPGDAARFVDASKVEEGFTNLDEMLGEILKAKPYLAKGKADGGVGSPATGGGKPAGSTEAGAEAAKAKKVFEAFPVIGRLAATRGGSK